MEKVFDFLTEKNKRTIATMLIFFLVKESFLYAMNSLAVNKLRTFLSLLGITIGIFSIISVFTVINSLESSIKTSISSLGEEVIYIQKWPWQFGGEYKWWEYLRRPVPKLEEAKKVRELSKLANASTFMVYPRKTIQYKDNSVEEVQIISGEHEYQDIKSFEIQKGRYFSPWESGSGKNRVIIGSELAENLFDEQNPIGKDIKLGGRKVNVVGVFAKEGEDMFGNSMDNNAFLPINYIRNIVNIKSENIGPLIMVEPKEGISAEELKEELRGIMRAIRRLKPTENDDFALNQASLISQGFESLFSIIDIAGIIIGGFSIIVGGFGIANIMFVSVKEQTRLIGIQKALGAKRYFILFQFLFEAVILCLIGGLVGLLLVFIATQLLGAASEMDFFMSAGNVTSGILLSVTIGIISGILPAMKASKLDPVEAMNS